MDWLPPSVLSTHAHPLPTRVGSGHGADAVAVSCDCSNGIGRAQWSPHRLPEVSRARDQAHHTTILVDCCKSSNGGQRCAGSVPNSGLDARWNQHVSVGLWQGMAIHHIYVHDFIECIHLCALAVVQFTSCTDSTHSSTAKKHFGTIFC